MGSRTLILAAMATLASGGQVAAQGIGGVGSLDVEQIEPKRIRAVAPVSRSPHSKHRPRRDATIDRRYSARFLCGQLAAPIRIGKPPVPRDLLALGDYLTGISIHNPNAFPVEFTKKAVETNPEREPRGRVGEPVTEILGPDEGIEIDCLDVMALLDFGEFRLAQLNKGFVVITSAFELDVVGTYSYKSVTASCLDGSGGTFLCDVSSFRFVR